MTKRPNKLATAKWMRSLAGRAAFPFQRLDRTHKSERHTKAMAQEASRKSHHQRGSTPPFPCLAGSRQQAERSTSTSNTPVERRAFKYLMKFEIVFVPLPRPLARLFISILGQLRRANTDMVEHFCIHTCCGNNATRKNHGQENVNSSTCQSTRRRVTRFQPV